MMRLGIKDWDGRLQKRLFVGQRQTEGWVGGLVGELEIGPKARHSMPRSRLHPAPLQRALKSLQSHSDKL